VTSTSRFRACSSVSSSIQPRPFITVRIALRRARAMSGRFSGVSRFGARTMAAISAASSTRSAFGDLSK
jgi:hypothetical protein